MIRTLFEIVFLVVVFISLFFVLSQMVIAFVSNRISSSHLFSWLERH